MLLGTHKTADEMVDVYVDLTNKFPSIITLIDPLRKEVGSKKGPTRKRNILKVLKIWK